MSTDLSNPCSHCCEENTASFPWSLKMGGGEALTRQCSRTISGSIIRLLHCGKPLVVVVVGKYCIWVSLMQSMSKAHWNISSAPHISFDFYFNFVRKVGPHPELKGERTKKDLGDMMRNWESFIWCYFQGGRKNLVTKYWLGYSFFLNWLLHLQDWIEVYEFQDF